MSNSEHQHLENLRVKAELATAEYQKALTAMELERFMGSLEHPTLTFMVGIQDIKGTKVFSKYEIENAVYDLKEPKYSFNEKLFKGDLELQEREYDYYSWSVTSKAVFNGLFKKYKAAKLHYQKLTK